jgi:regulator of replication initiation timing
LEEERDQLQLRVEKMGRQLTNHVDSNAALRRENEELRRQLLGNSEVGVLQ